jgi:hypothetical protein
VKSLTLSHVELDSQEKVRGPGLLTKGRALRTQQTLPLAMVHGPALPHCTTGHLPLLTHCPLPLQVSQIGSQARLQQRPPEQVPCRQSLLVEQRPPGPLWGVMHVP